MIITELELKSPSIPFFKGGIFLCRLLPSLAKHALSKAEGRGRGDFGAEWRRELFDELRFQDASDLLKLFDGFTGQNQAGLPTQDVK
jgi:hypothetical protein